MSIENKIGSDITENLFDNDSNDGVYLFFSFDLVNSTAFKTGYPKEWKKVFKRFYEITKEEMSKRYSWCAIWKYIGDEVLIYVKVYCIDDVYDSPMIASEVSNKCY